MSATTSTVPATVPATAPTAAITRISNTSLSTFGLPSGIALPQLDGSNWAHWSGTLEALLSLFEAEDVIRLSTNPDPANVSAEVWDSLQRRAKAYLCLYTKQDVYSLVASDVDLLTFKHKWDVLKVTYSGESGSTTIFNMWINLTQAKLDNSAPLAPQLAKLNETRVALSNASMGVTDTQYSLILLNALPPSYEAVATILLASGPPTSLKASEITARLINEEGRRAGPSTSLNTMAKAPIKGTGKGKKKDHSNLTCHYCQKKGHIQPDCRKKKKDDADKKKKEEGGSGSGGNKAANSHVLVPTSASIEEVNDNIGVALYTAKRVRWMMDSGATHHITPHRSDFKDYTLCKGSVCLGDKSTIDQVGVGSVVFTTNLGTPITLSNVLHIPQVKTRFMSTRALAQKGAEVSFTQSSFKIVVNQCCVAEGYLEDNLYWLDAGCLFHWPECTRQKCCHTGHLASANGTHVSCRIKVLWSLCPHRHGSRQLYHSAICVLWVRGWQVHLQTLLCVLKQEDICYIRSCA
jgi:hypothetical protein